MPIAWGAIAESLVIITAGVAQVPGAAEAIKVMKALAGIEDAQAVMLQRIGSDVQLIRTGPFRAAREHLDTAMRKAEAGTEYEHHLREADDLLVQALGQCASAEESSVIQFNLGVVAAIRGDRAEARYRLKQAYEDCAKVTRELSARAADVLVFGPRETAVALIAAPIIAPITITAVAAYKYRKKEKRGQATTALRAYLPFAETVAQAHNVIEPTAILPAPQLSGDSGKGYLLKWSEPGR